MDVARGDFDDFQIRPATPADAEAIALAHLDSIRSLGPVFYPEEVVRAWSAGLGPALYVNAMNDGEAFFIATGLLDQETVVLGFSTHRVDDAQDGVSVYVRGRAARRGIGTLLLQQAGRTRPCTRGKWHPDSGIARRCGVLQGERVRSPWSRRCGATVRAFDALRFHAKAASVTPGA